MMKKTTYILLLLILLTACRQSIPSDAVQVTQEARTTPNDNGATLPPNIAPLNFCIDEEGDSYITRFYTKNGDEIVCCGKTTDVSTNEWHKLLQSAKGDILYTDIYVKNAGKWTRFATRKNPVASEEIDPYITFRLIAPSYIDYEKLTLCERQTENFKERVLYDNMMLNDGDDGQCINCHLPSNYNRDGQSQFHVRQLKGGTVFINKNEITKVNLKTDKTLSAGVYPAWHPSANFVAYSVNETGQVFHTLNTQKIEVIDFASDLILYDIKNNKVYDIDCKKDEFESFPTWSPDGEALYYISAHYEQKSNDIDADLNDDYLLLKYNIYARSFDAKTLKFGEKRLVFDADSLNKSASQPRISPDGRYLLFTLGDYGQFHVWHHSGELYAIDLKTGEAANMTAANSDASESYHSWSSNGRWILFSSRRGDGNYTRLYISYFDEQGCAHKPFLLPQRYPDYYAHLFKSYNVAEWLVEPVQPNLIELTNAIEEEAIQAKYAGSALKIPDEKGLPARSTNKKRIGSAVQY